MMKKYYEEFKEPNGEVRFVGIYTPKEQARGYLNLMFSEFAHKNIKLIDKNKDLN